MVLGTPVWKSPCVVSVMQELGGAAVSEKFCVVVLPSVTAIEDAEALPKAGLVAVIDGYRPAGTWNE